MRQPVHIVTLALLFTVRHACAAPSPSAVPVDLAAYHVPVFRNEYVTVFHIEIPGKHASDYHTHSEDEVTVTLTDYPPEAELQKLGEPPTPSRAAHGGDVAYIAHFQNPVTHRTINPGTRSINVIATMLQSPRPYGFTAGVRNANGYTQILDNDRVRGWRLVLSPGEATTPITQSAPGFRIVIRGGDIVELVPGRQERGEWLTAGEFAWQDPGVTRAVRNIGSTTIEIVELEYK